MPSIYSTTQNGAGYHQFTQVNPARLATNERLHQELCASPLFRQILQQNGLGHLTPGQISVAVEQYRNGDAPVILFWQTGTGTKHAIEAAQYKGDSFLCGYALYQIGLENAPVAGQAAQPEERRRVPERPAGAAPEPREEHAPVLDTLIREQREQMGALLGEMREQRRDMEGRYQALLGALSDRARDSERDMQELFAATVNTMQQKFTEMQGRFEASRGVSEDRFLKLFAAMQKNYKQLILGTHAHHRAVVDDLRRYAEARADATEGRFTGELAAQREEHLQMRQIFAEQLEAMLRQQQALFEVQARADVQRSQELMQHMRELHAAAAANAARVLAPAAPAAENEARLANERAQADRVLARVQENVQEIKRLREALQEARAERDRCIQQMNDGNERTQLESIQRELRAALAERDRVEESREARLFEYVDLLNSNLSDALTRQQTANQQELQALIRERQRPEEPICPRTPRVVYRDRPAPERPGLAALPPSRPPSPAPEPEERPAPQFFDLSRPVSYEEDEPDPLDKHLDHISEGLDQLQRDLAAMQLAEEEAEEAAQIVRGRELVAAVREQFRLPAPTAAEMAAAEAQLAEHD